MTTCVNLRRRLVLLLVVLPVLLGGCLTLSLQDEIAGLMKEGQQLYSEKKYDAAVDKFLVITTKDPKYWQAYLWAARTYIAKGGWTEAIANGKKAFELAPKGQDVIPVFGEALFGGGSDALKNGRYPEAIGLFVDYLKLEPGNAKAWLNVGKSYLGQRQFREALGAFAQGLSQGNGAERSELIRGLLDGGKQAFASGKYDEAIKLLKEYLKYDKNDLSAYMNLAKSYWESGEIGAALDNFRQVLKLDPRDEEALRFLLRR
jgi:tetratricopeptide (TPR) repeat protein